MSYGVLAETFQNRGKLLADQDEEHVPEGDVLQARGGIGEEAWVSPSPVETVGHHGQDARDVHYLLGDDVDRVGRQQRERDKDGGVAHALPQGQDEPSQDQSQYDPSPADQEEVQTRLPHRERPRNNRSDSNPEGHERRAVVDEALAPYYRAHPFWHSQATEDRLCRHRIGWGKDCPEDEGCGPRQADQDMPD